MLGFIRRHRPLEWRELFLQFIRDRGAYYVFDVDHELIEHAGKRLIEGAVEHAA